MSFDEPVSIPGKIWVLHGAEDDLCTDLEGQIWEDGDPTMKEPINDTHPNCNCTLDDIEITSDILNPFGEVIKWSSSMSFQNMLGNAIPISESAIGEPLEGQHACRLVEAEELRKNGFTRFRQSEIEIDGKKAIRIIAFKGDRASGTGRTQSVRFPTDSWTAEQAQKWCTDHSGTFERAAELSTTEIKELASDPLKIQESFKWVPDMDKVRALSKQSKGRFLKIVALHPIVTDRKDEGHGSRKFTDDELKRSARTLANTLPNLLHKVKMVHGTNQVMDSEEEDGRLEALVYLEDHEILKGIRERIIDKVSVQGNAREAPEVCRSGTCAKEPKGIIYNGLAFVNSKQQFVYNGTTYPPVPPGDVRTSIEILETNTSTKSNSSLSSVNSSKTQMDFTDELGKQILAPMMKIAENLENVVDAINKTDAPADFKEKLIAMAKQLYSEQKPPPPPTETKTDPAVLKRLEQTEESVKSIADIKKIVEELKSRDDKKLEELFNKVLTEKLEPLQKQVTEIKAAPPSAAGTTANTKQLEELTENQIGKALAEKIRDQPLSEIMTKHLKVTA